MGDAIPVDEYQRWLPPKVAIDQLRPVRTDVVIDALTASIRSGDVRVSARRITRLYEGRSPEQIGSYELLEAGNWIDHAEQRFWELGSITYEESDGFWEKRGLLHIIPGTRREISGTRLDPVGIDNLRAQLQPPRISVAISSPEDRRATAFEGWPHLARGGDEMTFSQIRTEAAIGALAPLAHPSPKEGFATNAQVDVWFNSLSPQDREQSVRKLYQKANADLHPLRVVRSQVEPFRKGKGTGPKKRG